MFPNNQMFSGCVIEERYITVSVVVDAENIVTTRRNVVARWCVDTGDYLDSTFAMNSINERIIIRAH